MNKLVTLILLTAPCFAEDTVTFDARTTGSLGQMHVRKGKTLIINHLNRIKNDYQLQRNITVLAPQTDILSGLSFIPSAPSSTPAAAPAAGGAATPAPITPAALQATGAGTDPSTAKSAVTRTQAISPRTGPGLRGVAPPPPPPPTYTSDDAQKFLNLFAQSAANDMLVTLAGNGFSAADLQIIKTAMLTEATKAIGNMNLNQVAAAMQANAEKPYQDAIVQAEAAGYKTSAPYIQHVQFTELSKNQQAVSTALTTLQQHVSTLKDAVAAADRKLADALTGAQAFAVASDSLDVSTMEQPLRDQLAALTAVSDNSSNWPYKNRDDVNSELLRVSQAFALLASEPGYSDWKATDAAKDSLAAISATLAADTTYINGLNPDNTDRVTAVNKAKAVLAHFSLVAGLPAPERDTIQANFSCNDDTQKATFTLVINNLTDNMTAASVEVVTFTCYAPLSLTGGIGFNSLAERTYQLVTPAGASTSGSTAPASAIQYDKNSSFQIAPLLLLHVRIANLGDCCAAHASFGAGVSIPASGSGTTSGNGTQPTYLGGLSLSLRDKLYFTFGPFFGRTNTLANGYSIGSTLPSGVTTIPLETKFSAGVGVAVTFKLK